MDFFYICSYICRIFLEFAKPKFESRISLKLVLGACKLSHFPLVLMNRFNKTESAVF